MWFIAKVPFHYYNKRSRGLKQLTVCGIIYGLLVERKGIQGVVEAAHEQKQFRIQDKNEISNPLQES